MAPHWSIGQLLSDPAQGNNRAKLRCRLRAAGTRRDIIIVRMTQDRFGGGPLFLKALVPVDLTKLDEARTAIDAAQKLAPNMAAELIILAMEGSGASERLQNRTSQAKEFQNFVDDQSSRLQRIIYGRYCQGDDLMTEVTSIVDSEGIDLVVMPPRECEKMGSLLGAAAIADEQPSCSVLMLR